MMVYKYKVFRYKTNTEIKQRLAYKNRIKATKEGEVLTGIVQEKKASDIEERFAKALSKEGISYTFQKSYLAPRNTAGNYMLDFLVEGATKPLPVAIDGEFAHRTAEQKGKDAYKDNIFNTKNSYRFQKVIRVSFDGKLDGKYVLPGLQTQDKADESAKELIWRYHLQ